MAGDNKMIIVRNWKRGLYECVEAEFTLGGKRYIGELEEKDRIESDEEKIERFLESIKEK